MKLTKLYLFLATISALVISSDRGALAGSATANLAVSATVNNNCTISTVAVSFNPYDPLSATPDDSTGGSVTITCTKNSAPTIGLGFGQHESPTGQANMSDGTNPLMYALYKDAPGGAAWGNSGVALLTPPATPSKAPRTYTVYGRIPAGQDVPSGTYNDLVVATVNF
jgi:spore coat protein U-like protein